MSSEAYEPVDYDNLAPLDFHFKLKGNSYVLHEPTESADLAHRKALFRSMRNGSRPDEGFAELDTVLLSGCVYRIEHDGKEAKVDAGTLRTIFPRRVIKDLVKRAEAMSGGADDEQTLEGIDRKIEALQKKREALANGEDPVKKVLSSMIPTSG